MRERAITGMAMVSCFVFLAACGDEGGDGERGESTSPATDDQTPPMGASALEAWLETGAYKRWHCEPTMHASRSPSPHGYNRICTNDLLAADALGTGTFARGAAAVKELYDSADAKQPSGYSVALKSESDSMGGASWYWYERLPGGTLVADGPGDDGAERSICVGCHVAAGSDPAHTPTPGARDFVYTPVE